MKNIFYIILIIFSSISSQAQQIIGDIKPSFRTSDHNGWYLLNGRAISSLPPAAQTAANGLGLSTLPNASGRYLKGKNTTESLGALSGNNSVTLTQANLPSFNFTPTTSQTASNGSHSHTVDDITPVYPGNEIIYRPRPGFNLWEPNAPISNTVTTSENGAHQHSFSFNMNPTGTAAPLVIEPSYITTNSFIYLGE